LPNLQTSHLLFFVSELSGNGNLLSQYLPGRMSAKFDRLFSYSCLSHYKGEIRLLELTEPADAHSKLAGNLFTVPIPEAGPYKALSYCWESSECGIPISLNGKDFYVTKNLAAALEHIQYEPGLYWIDAICINQADVEERSLQVSRMKGIYSQASEVIVWLGGIIELGFIFPSTTGLQSDAGRSCFFKNDYWRRVWVVQEFAVSSRIRILHHRGHINWDELTEIMSSPSILQQRHENETVSEELVGIESIQRLINLRQSFIQGHPIGLLDLLYSSKSLVATDERDRIYGLLGLAHDRNLFVAYPRYDITPTELYISMATTYLQKTGNLDILFIDQCSKSNSLPSWVPRWLRLCGPRSLQWVERLAQRSRQRRRLTTLQVLPRSLNGSLVARGRQIGVLDVLSSPCHGGESVDQFLERSTARTNQATELYESRSAVVQAILTSLCFGLELCNQNITHGVIEYTSAVQRLASNRLVGWISENHTIRIQGESLSDLFHKPVTQTWTSMLTEYAWHGGRLISQRISPPLVHIPIQLGFQKLEPEGIKAQKALSIVKRQEILDTERPDQMIEASNDFLSSDEPGIVDFLNQVDSGLRIASSSRIRLVVTEEGLIGIASRYASQAHVVVQLDGCERLVVLRKVQGDEELWGFIGEAWFCGGDDISTSRCDYAIV
jgi:hypothetical protein